MEVGFIGIGSIGLPMARRLRGAGHDMVIHDVNRAGAEAFVREGGTLVGSPREVGDRVETVFCSLPNPEIVRAVTLGADGVVHGSKVKTIVDLSTTGPGAAIAIGADALKHGKQLVDAPVSGGPVGAANGTVAVMVSGPQDHVERIMPLVSAIGRVFVIGDKVGQGHTMKLLNNILSATSIAATTETIVLGVKAGLDAKVMIDVLNASSGRNTATSDKYPRSILNRTFKYGFRTDLLLKDVRLLQSFAREMGAKLRVGDAVIETWSLAEAEYQHEDYTNLVKVLEREAGVTVGTEELPEQQHVARAAS